VKFFNPYAQIEKTLHRLPHWQQAGATYFITYRLADSVPKQLRDQWESERAIWLQLNPPPHTPEKEMEYHERFSQQMERWLDAGHGECLLRQPICAGIVGDALRHFDGERCCQIAWVVMPNHVHLLVVPHPEWALEQLLHSWKGFTSNQINLHLKRSGELWQRSYFDRLIRDADHFANCVRYIRRNPVKARLRAGEYLLYESDLAKAVT
jgi:putative transposase